MEESRKVVKVEESKSEAGYATPIGSTTRTRSSAAIYTIDQKGHKLALPPLVLLSGDHIWKVTPVPIPNTVVKLPEPMIVLQA